MTKNPIMMLLEPLEKLITEHGSAVIQEKHKLLFVQDRLTTEQIAKTLKIHSQEAKFHIKELLNHRPPLVHIASSIGKPTTWYLAQEGRRYLIKNKPTS